MSAVEKAIRAQVKTSMQNMEFYAECFKIEASKIREYIEELEHAEKTQYKSSKSVPSSESKPTISYILCRREK